MREHLMGVSDSVLCITEIILLFSSVVHNHTALQMLKREEYEKMMKNRNKKGNKY